MSYNCTIYSIQTSMSFSIGIYNPIIFLMDKKVLKKAPKMAKMIDKMDIDFLERSYTFKAQGQQHTVSLSPWHIANIEARDEDEDEAGLESEQYGDDSA